MLDVCINFFILGSCISYKLEVYNYCMSFQNNNENYVSMSLRTVANSRRAFLDNKINSLDVSDIEGARPRFIEKPRHIREVLNNRNDDIQKSSPNVIIPKTVNKPDRQLMVDDIQGSRTKVNKFTTTRKTNPLVPVYQLPVVEYMPFPQPKYIRDNMQVDDIQGTRTKETYALKLERAGKVQEKDQTPLQTKHKLVPRKDNFLFDVKDINNYEKPNRGDRSTNPLQPVYKIPTSKDDILGGGRSTQMRFIQKSKPSVPKQRRNITEYNNLLVQDIPGAVVKPQRKLITSKAEQIIETKVGSLKRGISTKRATNPLQPDYPYIGAAQIKNASFSRPKTAAQRLDAFISNF